MTLQNSRQKADNVAEKIRVHLMDSATRNRLGERFGAAREQLTTSIGEAARITGVTAEKARYIQDAGILSPSRSNENQDTGHRRYSLNQLNKLIIVNDLIAHGFSVNDISNYLDRDQTTVDSLAEKTQSPDLATRLRDAETFYLQRMLIPRLLYFVQCLLLGDVMNCSVAIILPVARDSSDQPADSSDDSPADSPADSTADARPTVIERLDELPLIGPSLIGWHSRSHPYCVLYMDEPRIDDAARYALYGIDRLCSDAGVPDIDAHPTGAYLVIEREFASQLQVMTTSRARSEPSRTSSYPFLEPSGLLRGDSETTWAKRTNPLAVAYRLLRMLRQSADEETGRFGHNYSSVGDGMVYSSPELSYASHDMAGDKLLTVITELVVRLGNGAPPDANTHRGRWIFSAILLPDDPSLPREQQSLVVTVQSALSPHTPGVTRLTPGRNKGLSTLAALSGHMLMRSVMDSSDAAVADIGLEGDPGPALALPIMNEHGRVLAVLYVRAGYDKDTSTNDTFTTDDQLLLRVFGHIIGGLVSSYRGNYLARSVLTNMFNEPRNVDRFLQEFKTANAFWDDLGVALKGQIAAKNVREAEGPASEKSAINPITLFAVDIDGYTHIVNEYGSNTARHLVLAVGQRIAGQPLLKDSLLLGAPDRGKNRLYHVYGDRFFLLLQNIRSDEALSYADDLLKLLNGSYSLDITRTSGSQIVRIATTKLEKVTVSLALISCDSEFLSKMLASTTPDEHERVNQTQEPVQHMITAITSALDTGLIQAKQNGLGAQGFGTGVYLDTGTTLFRQLPKSSKDEQPSSRATRPLEKAANSDSSGRNY